RRRPPVVRAVPSGGSLRAPQDRTSPRLPLPRELPGGRRRLLDRGAGGEAAVGPLDRAGSPRRRLSPRGLRGIARREAVPPDRGPDAGLRGAAGDAPESANLEARRSRAPAGRGRERAVKSHGHSRRGLPKRKAGRTMMSAEEQKKAHNGKGGDGAAKRPGS